MDNFTGVAAVCKLLPKKGMNEMLQNRWVQFCFGASMLIWSVRWW